MVSAIFELSIFERPYVQTFMLLSRNAQLGPKCLHILSTDLYLKHQHFPEWSKRLLILNRPLNHSENLVRSHLNQFLHSVVYYHQDACTVVSVKPYKLLKQTVKTDMRLVFLLIFLSASEVNNSTENEYIKRRLTDKLAISQKLCQRQHYGATAVCLYYSDICYI